MAVREDAVAVYLYPRNVTGAAKGARAFLPLSYEVDLDMLELADAWSLKFPFDADLYAACEPDTEIRIELNGRPICSGFVDDRVRHVGRSGSFIDLNGRDRGGRLVDSSAPIMSFAGVGLLDLVRKLVTSLGSYPLFPNVSLQNAKNRRLMAGGDRHAKVSSEPPITLDADVDRRIRPGETRAQVLEFWFEQAGVLGWSSADGREFIVGNPNYQQEPQFAFTIPAPRSPRSLEGNVLEYQRSDSCGERYARIICLGSGAGGNRNHRRRHGKHVQGRGEALQGPNADGTGATFQIPKDLIIGNDDLKSNESAKKRAEREMKLREQGATHIEILVAGHSQPMGDERTPSNYAPDLMVRLLDEEVDRSPSDLLITRCHLSGGRMGQTTRLTLVPKGTDLVGISG